MLRMQEEHTTLDGKQASVHELDDYMEQLYEESMEEKVTASHMIALLSRRQDTLEHVLTHETLLGALSR